MNGCVQWTLLERDTNGQTWPSHIMKIKKKQRFTKCNLAKRKKSDYLVTESLQKRPLIVTVISMGGGNF